MSSGPEHPEADMLERYRRRALSPAEFLSIGDHIAGCELCRRQLAEGGRLAAAVTAVRADLQAEAEAEPAHLSAEQLTAYVDQELDAFDRETTEAHLEFCSRCADRVRELRGFEALMSTYPAKEHAPASAPPLWQRVRSLVSQPFVWLPAQTLGVAAVAAWLVFWVVARPLQIELDRQQAVVQQLQGARASLDAQLERLRQETARAQGDKVALSAEVGRLRQRVAQLQTGATPPRPGPPPTDPQGSGARIALNDGGGGLRVDASGNLVREEALPPEVRKAVADQQVSLPVVIASLAEPQAVLRARQPRGRAVGLRAPLGTVILADRPTFSWQPRGGATGYAVSVYDADLKRVAQSEAVPGTEWTVPNPLPRGRIYQWDVTALKDGAPISMPAATPSPRGKFRIADAETAAELGRARKTHGDSPLTLGVLYARAGLLEAAEREFESLARANPHSALARKLLDSVRARLRGTP